MCSPLLRPRKDEASGVPSSPPLPSFFPLPAKTEHDRWTVPKARTRKDFLLHDKSDDQFLSLLSSRSPDQVFLSLPRSGRRVEVGASRPRISRSCQHEQVNPPPLYRSIVRSVPAFYVGRSCFCGRIRSFHEPSSPLRLHLVRRCEIHCFFFFLLVFLRSRNVELCLAEREMTWTVRAQNGAPVSLALVHAARIVRKEKKWNTRERRTRRNHGNRLWNIAVAFNRACGKRDFKENKTFRERSNVVGCKS